MIARQSVPDGWHESLRDQCIANGIDVDVNEYGTLISVHHCMAGDHRYAVCPPSPNEAADCLTAGCVSYEPSRDASIFFAPDDPTLIESQ